MSAPPMKLVLRNVDGCLAPVQVPAMDTQALQDLMETINALRDATARPVASEADDQLRTILSGASEALQELIERRVAENPSPLARGPVSRHSWGGETSRKLVAVRRPRASAPVGAGR